MPRGLTIKKTPIGTTVYGEYLGQRTKLNFSSTEAVALKTATQQGLKNCKTYLITKEDE